MNKERVNAGAVPEAVLYIESPAPTAPLSPVPVLSAELCGLLHLHWAPAHPSWCPTPQNFHHITWLHILCRTSHTHQAAGDLLGWCTNLSLIKGRRKMNVHSHVVPCPCSWGGRGWTDWEFWSLVTHSLGAHSILSLAVQHSWHQEHWTSADPTRTASSKMLHSFPGHPALQDGSRDTGCTGTVQRTGGRSLHLGLQDVLPLIFSLSSLTSCRDLSL